MTKHELAELDLAVARAESKRNPRIEEPTPFSDHCCMVEERGADDEREYWANASYEPTRDGAEAVRLLTKHALTVGPSGSAWWSCRANERNGELPPVLGYSYGPSPAIAICRAVVALKAAA